MGILKLLQETGRRVHVLFPTLVQRRVGRDQLQPLLVGELGLHAAAPALAHSAIRIRLAGLVFGGPEHVPAQVNDGSGGGLLLGLLDHQVAMDDRILVLAVEKAEIRTPDGRVLASHREYPVRVLRPLIGKVVLARQDALARDGAQGLQQRARLRCSVGVDRIAGVRGRRGLGKRIQGCANGRGPNNQDRFPHVSARFPRDITIASIAGALRSWWGRRFRLPLQNQKKTWQAKPPAPPREFGDLYALWTSPPLGIIVGVRYMRQTALLIFPFLLAVHAQQYTRGVGVYPGDPREGFSPALVPDAQTYRNLALHRAAYQSSSYDFYHTAQLVTDGIKDSTLPRWFSIATSDRGTLSRQEREHAVDHNLTTRVSIGGPPLWIQVETGGGEAPFEIDRIDVTAGGGFGRGGGQAATGGAIVVSGSDDGQSWTELGRTTPPPPPAPAPGAGRGFGFAPSPIPVKFSAPAHTRFYRVAYEGGAGRQWAISELAFFHNNERVEIGGPYHFTSAWKPAGSGQEWVYVDLGTACTFDRVVLDWIRRAAEGSVQVSDDAKSWRTLQALPAAGGAVDDLKLAQPARGRYVRVLVTKPATPDGYVLSELEVYGRGGPVPKPHPAPAADASGRLPLSGGAWRIQRDSLVTAGGPALSQPGFPDKDWLVATVPATVLSSSWNVGAIPDPNYGDNINAISDSFFYADFWYRDEFVAPALPAGRHAWLHFRGIDWKADVYLNGEMLGPIEGGFIRGEFDVTRTLKPGARNAIAVRIHKNATPGSAKEKTWESPDPNGGAIGADNPTYHATAGWDWIPSVRGRDIGIWSDIYLEASGPVTIENPYASTTLPLPDTSSADVAVEATLRNSGVTAVSGTLRGRFGDVAFETPVTVGAGAAVTVKLDPTAAPALRLRNPKLWWPAGYGDQNLYQVRLEFVTAGG